MAVWRITRNLLTLVLFLGPLHFALASFEITEIMYDLDGTDTNREWVEVQNTGSDSLDLSKWYFFSDNSKHALTPQGTSLVPAGGYAVIAQNVPKFKIDWPDFSGMLFDSSWTGFNNDGETIALKDPDLNTVSEISFTSSGGGAGNGDSLQKINSTWSGGAPTPGAGNQASSSVVSNSSVVTSTTSSSTSSSGVAYTQNTATKKKEVEVPKIMTNIIASTNAVAELEFNINSETTGYKKEPMTYGRFSWNFGDGTTKDQNGAQPFGHTYIYPGDYVITLNYYQYPNNTIADATDRLIVSVIPSGVSISSVGTATDPFIELENTSAVEVDLSRWLIEGSFNKFLIPQGTIILPKKKLRFSPKVTSFTAQDMPVVTLYNPAGEIFAAYPLKKSVQYSTRVVNATSFNSPKAPALSNSHDISAPSVIDLNELGASAATAGSQISTSMMAGAGLALVIVLGVSSVFIIRRRNMPDDDIDKELRASDITIIE